MAPSAGHTLLLPGFKGRQGRREGGSRGSRWPGWLGQVIHSAVTQPKVMLPQRGRWRGAVASPGGAGQEGLCPFNFITANSVFVLLSIDVRAKITHSENQFEKHPVSDWNPQEAGREPR